MESSNDPLYMYAVYCTSEESTVSISTDMYLTKLLFGYRQASASVFLSCMVLNSFV